MLGRRGRTIATAAAVAALLTGCATAHAGSPSVPSLSAGTTRPGAQSSTTVAGGLPDTSTLTPAPLGGVDEETGQTVGSHPVPSWDAASKDAAVAAGQAVMTAFARPTVDYATWWAGLEPLLTPQAAQDYSWVDPANVPVSAVTGSGSLVDDTSAWVATVSVPTNVGTYTVVLARVDAASPWLATRITPPAGLD